MSDFKWSKYNYMFKSDKYGYLLYNSLTNSFAELSKPVFRKLEKLKKKPDGIDFSDNPGLFLQLSQAKILIDKKEEGDMLDIVKMKRLSKSYASDSLTLTIAPTTACNFCCPYCYEKSVEPVSMTEETETELIRFIKRFLPLKRLNVVWYGGEPLLKFDVIQHLSATMNDLEPGFRAVLVTNGYLLNKNIVDKLKELKIKAIQVTIDGKKEVHDRRRVQKNGQGTYSMIMSNLGYLVNNWEGLLKIRVNVDVNNHDEFIEVYREIQSRFKNKKIKVYPGIISDNENNNPDITCQFNREEEFKFYLKLYQDYGIRAFKFYPERNFSGCVATTKNALVIGPEGDIYKCWHDMGIKERLIGNINGEKPWNNNLLARYMVGSNHYDKKECQDCFFLPVCNGGCTQQRMINKYHGGNNDYCLCFKDNLSQLLESYYEIKQQKQKHSS